MWQQLVSGKTEAGPTVSDLVALLSLAVAASTALFASWQAMIARDHNRRSLRPFLTTLNARNEGMPFIELINNGTGPAFAYRVAWYYRNHDNPQEEERFHIVADPEKAGQWLRDLFEIDRLDDGNDKIKSRHFGRPVPIRAGESIKMLYFEELTDEEYWIVWEKIKYLYLCVFYKSIYEKYDICVRTEAFEKVIKTFSIPLWGWNAPVSYRKSILPFLRPTGWRKLPEQKIYPSELSANVDLVVPLGKYCFEGRNLRRRH